MIKQFLHVSSILIVCVSLGACAAAIDGQTQDVQFLTPGATNAECEVRVEGLRYIVRPPQSTNLFKSKQDLVVDCKAPGGRNHTVYIKPKLESSAALNALNGGVGLAWDYGSGALWHYPDIIEVDFTDAPIVDPAPPAQNAPDIRQPEEYDLEEYSPSQPRLNADKHAPPVEILRRESASQSSGRINNTEQNFQSSGEGTAGRYTAEPLPLSPGQ